MKSVSIDSRYLDPDKFPSGIGQVLRRNLHLIIKNDIQKNIHWILIGNTKIIQEYLQSNNIKHFTQEISNKFNSHKTFHKPFSKVTKDFKITIIEFQADLYSIKEQFILPFKIPKCDLFWSPYFISPLIPIKAKKRLISILDVNHMALPYLYKWYVILIWKVLFYGSLFYADKILTISNFSKSEIIKYAKVREDKIQVNYLAIDLNKFNVISDNNLKLNVKEKYKLPEKFFLYIGNVKPHKNLKTLLQAFNLLIKDKSTKTGNRKTSNVKGENLKSSFDYKLVIVGQKDGFVSTDNSVGKYLEENPHLNDDIIFTGYVSDKDIPVIYNLAYSFIFPTLYEGFGLPPLEAFACNCPCLVSDIPCLKEVCENAVLYFKPKSKLEIKNAILKIIKNKKLKDDLINKGSKQVLKFDIEKSSQGIYNLILDLLDVNK